MVTIFINTFMLNIYIHQCTFIRIKPRVRTHLKTKSRLLILNVECRIRRACSRFYKEIKKLLQRAKFYGSNHLSCDHLQRRKLQRFSQLKRIYISTIRLKQLLNISFRVHKSCCNRAGTIFYTLSCKCITITFCLQYFTSCCPFSFLSSCQCSFPSVVPYVRVGT